jgi:hypothetical protein
MVNSDQLNLTHETETSSESAGSDGYAAENGQAKPTEADLDREHERFLAKRKVEETAEPDLEHEHFSARGTLLFLLVMLLGYALYWAYLWFIVVIERGGGW